jgi:polyhydroxyalkanoate synthesis repressor PhaR
MITIKKYSNRRLYDTSESRYVTLEELANKIREGADVRVVDAKSEEDLTQSILAQIIIESRGAARLLPTSLLIRLIRMEDDALAEFFGHYMVWALDVYKQVRRSAETLSPLSALATLPFTGPSALARIASHIYSGNAQKVENKSGPNIVKNIKNNIQEPTPISHDDLDIDPARSELAALRRELAELRAIIESK